MQKGNAIFCGVRSDMGVANTCGQGSDFACDSSKRKCEERCIIVFLVKEVFAFVLYRGQMGGVLHCSKLDYG